MPGFGVTGRRQELRRTAAKSQDTACCFWQHSTKVGRSSALLGVSAYADIGRSAPIKPFGQSRLQSRTSMAQMRYLQATFRSYGWNSVDTAQLTAAPAGRILTSGHRSFPTTKPPPNPKVGRSGHEVERARRVLSLVRVNRD